MKKLFLIMSLSVLMVVAAACGSNEVNGKGPEDIPLEWANADTQRDQSKLLSLLDKKETALDPEDKADNNKTVEKYKLIEWKGNNNNYFYEISYENPIKKDTLKIEQMEVIKTDDGWKRTAFGDLKDFDKLVEDLKPKVLREMNDK
ncbi:hypothetical protein [Peribacillus frigoritolerans]|uniref:hypothetical protein n=1 Tax=Peribacillus frigoritolerans TaxID=450367 RepID=UPI00105929FC|nr:hypothetical protein [Peribacillus frigoritolerans]TDL76170.1 hypothetical protein E2R53_21000 [Peribacillus frigoritolerans]